MSHWYAIAGLIGAFLGLASGMPLGYHLGMIAKRLLLDETQSIWTPAEIQERMREIGEARELALFAKEQLDKISSCGAL